MNLRAVIDWRAYFAGRWRLTRAIKDRLGERVGAAEGEAQFRPGAANADLVCEEAVLIDYGGRRLKGEQVTLWRFVDPEGPILHFRGGRFFCSMRFERTAARWRAALIHHCGDDLYDGNAVIEGDDGWRLVWSVSGPRKDYTLDTRYRRDRS